MRVLVIGGSGGIGAALAADYAARGAAVTTLSRRGDGLDVTDEDSMARVLGALEAPFDRILVANGALELDGRGPEKSVRELSAGAPAAQCALNDAGPVPRSKHGLQRMQLQHD